MIILEDVFEITQRDPDGKRFDKGAFRSFCTAARRARRRPPPATPSNTALLPPPTPQCRATR